MIRELILCHAVLIVFSQLYLNLPVTKFFGCSENELQSTAIPNSELYFPGKSDSLSDNSAPVTHSYSSKHLGECTSCSQFVYFSKHPQAVLWKGPSMELSVWPAFISATAPSPVSWCSTRSVFVGFCSCPIWCPVLKWQELIVQLFSQSAQQCPLTTTNANIDHSWWNRFVGQFRSTVKDLLHSCANFNTKVVAAQLWDFLVSNFITLVQRFKEGWQYVLKLSEQFDRKLSKFLRQSFTKLLQCACTTIQPTSYFFKRFVEFLFNLPTDLCKTIEIYFQGKEPMIPLMLLISIINCILFFFNFESKFVACYRKLFERIQSSPNLLLFISMQFLTFIKRARRKQNSVIIVKSQFQVSSSIVFEFNEEMFLNLSELAQSEMFYSLMQSPQFNEFAKYLLQEMFNIRRTEEQREMFNYQSNRLLAETNNFLLTTSNLLLESSNLTVEPSNLL